MITYNEGVFYFPQPVSQLTDRDFAKMEATRNEWLREKAHKQK